MQTHFKPEQLENPAIAEAEKNLRKCVHCGFCTATCPTYVTLGNELDSPRGRIYLIKDVLENDRPADDSFVKHIDRCLSCLSCMTTCPSGVNYMHLIDHAREHIEKTYKRPLADRFIRRLLAATLPYPARFKTALRLAKFAKPLRRLFKNSESLKPIGTMLEMAPKKLPQVPSQPDAENNTSDFSKNVIMLSGCAQTVLDPEINAATRRLLNRCGVAIAEIKNEGCCGALVHHMGYEDQALAQARHNIDLWWPLIDAGKIDAIIITASGCGTSVKNYGFLFRSDENYREKAEKIASLAHDITEYLTKIELPVSQFSGEAKIDIAYHSACSMQHGQKITHQPVELLRKAGFSVKEPLEGHLCCGSAGTYNILQSEIATQLRDRKVNNIMATGAQVIASGNIGCMVQIGSGCDLPVVHTIELLDWAYGGPKPDGLENIH